MDNRLRLLGLVYRANKLILGENILDNFKKVQLLFIASDISEASRKRFLNKCEFYKVPYIDSYSSEELTNALGKKIVKTIGITDKGFTKLLLSKEGKNNG